MGKSQFILKKNNYFYNLTLCICAIISFLSVFLLPKSSFIKTINVVVRYNNSRFLIVITILLFLAFSIKNNRLSNLAIAFVIFPIFAFALNGLWASMYTETNVIAGILPRKDALSFFTSSMSLIERGYLVGYSTGRRPLFGGFFAALLWIFGKNMLASFASIAFISAVVTYFALIEVKKTFNPFAAIVFFIPQFLFYRHTIGNVMSEMLGYILGMVATSFFLIAYKRKKACLPNSIVLYLTGIFFFTLSQLARPGAIITLPLLVVFAGWLFKEENRKCLRILIYTVLIISFAFALNNFLLDQLTIQEKIESSNAFNGFYGVVSGGKDWNQIRRDFPELSTLEPKDRERRMMEVTLEELLTNPNNFIKGMRYQFSIIFSLEPIYNYNIYSYMLSNNLLVDKTLIYLFFILSLFGIIFTVYKNKNTFYRFILVMTMGFFFSLPVSPAYQSQYMRYYPASIPLLGLLPAIGITFILKPIFKRIHLSKYLLPTENENLFFIHNSFSILLTFLIIITPLLLKIHSQKNERELKGCPVGESEVVVNYFPGTEVTVTNIVKTWIPNISTEDFKIEINNIPDLESKNLFKSIPIPMAIFPSINFLNDQPLYVVIDPHQLIQRKTIFWACGIIDQSDKSTGVFYPRSIKEFYFEY